MTQKLICLAKDPHSSTHKVLEIMMTLDSLTPSQRKCKMRDSIQFSSFNVISLFDKSVRELTDTKDIEYIEKLRKVYLDKYLYNSSFPSPDVRDIEFFNSF